jgi:hypothetical protein
MLPTRTKDEIGKLSDSQEPEGSNKKKKTTTTDKGQTTTKGTALLIYQKLAAHELG